MSEITSSAYPVVTDSKEGDQYTIVRQGQLKKQTRAALENYFESLQYSRFIGLDDTPTTYVGNQGKVPQVNSTQDGLEFVSSDLAPSFITMPDTPSSYGTAGSFLKVNATSNGVEFTTAAFTQLSDTPATLSGNGSKKVKVNSGGTALEFTNDTFSSLSDTPAGFSGSGGYLVKVNAGETALEYVEDEGTGTGWAQYSDTVYDSGNKFTVAAGITSPLPNNAGSTITSHLPLGVTAFYDGTEITPENIGDAYELRVSFKVSNNNANGLADLILDIGDGATEIMRRTFTFPKGANTESSYTTTTAIFSLDTFVTTGGVLRINSITGTTSVWDINYVIVRTHKANAT